MVGIGAAKGPTSGPWVLSGDFKTTRHPSEKKSCNRINKAMTDFFEFIEDMGLVDPELVGGKYTWRKGDRHISAGRHDRFFFYEEWDNSFRIISQSILQRVISDHTPLLLQCGEWLTSKSYFKFENGWLHTKDFNGKVKNWLKSFNYSGKPDCVLGAKLKALKIKLKEWSKTIQGNLKMQNKVS